MLTDIILEIEKLITRRHIYCSSWDLGMNGRQSFGFCSQRTKCDLNFIHCRDSNIVQIRQILSHLDSSYRSPCITPCT
jgi:hypothetical protein